MAWLTLQVHVPTGLMTRLACTPRLSFNSLKVTSLSSGPGRKRSRYLDQGTKLWKVHTPEVWASCNLLTDVVPGLWPVIVLVWFPSGGAACTKPNKQLAPQKPCCPENETAQGHETQDYWLLDRQQVSQKPLSWRSVPHQRLVMEFVLFFRPGEHTGPNSQASRGFWFGT